MDGVRAYGFSGVPGDWMGDVRRVSAESQEIGWPGSLHCSTSADFLVSSFSRAFLCSPSLVANCLFCFNLFSKTVLTKLLLSLGVTL